MTKLLLSVYRSFFLQIITSICETFDLEDIFSCSSCITASSYRSPAAHLCLLHWLYNGSTSIGSFIPKPDFGYTVQNKIWGFLAIFAVIVTVICIVFVNMSCYNKRKTIKKPSKSDFLCSLFEKKAKNTAAFGFYHNYCLSTVSLCKKRNSCLMFFDKNA